MDNKLFLIVLVYLNMVQFIVACDRAASVCKKYCQVERDRCAGLKHPLCTKFNSTDLEPSFTDQIINLTSSDVRNTILFEINRFRNALALGHVMKQDATENLQVVKWSFDLQEILEAHLQYRHVCFQISPSDTEFVELSEFRAHKQGHTYIITELVNNIISSSYDKIVWNQLGRGDFNKIGCVMTESLLSAYKLYCLTNTVHSKNVTFVPKTTYEIGNPCKSCECSVIWSGLCDNDDPRKFSKHHHDNHFVLLCVMTGSALMLIIIIFGLVCLFWICIECISNPNESGTYTLRHKFNKQPCDTVIDEQHGTSV